MDQTITYHGQTMKVVKLLKHASVPVVADDGTGLPLSRIKIDALVEEVPRPEPPKEKRGYEFL